MSNLNEKEINIKINNEIKKYELLKKSFLKIYESESKTSKIRNENFNKLNTIINTDNKQLEDIYNLFTTEMRNLEKDRDNHLRKIIDLILPVIEYYPQKLKDTKKDLENFTKNKNIARNKGETIENEIMKFENERCEDNKCLFLQFIHSELKYHAGALEKISELFYNINKKEPYEELKKFAEDNKIEVDIEKIFGNVDMKKIMEEKKKREKQEKEETKRVYQSNDDDEIEESVNKNRDNKDNINLGSQFIEEY